MVHFRTHTHNLGWIVLSLTVFVPYPLRVQTSTFKGKRTSATSEWAAATRPGGLCTESNAVVVLLMFDVVLQLDPTPGMGNAC